MGQEAEASAQDTGRSGCETACGLGATYLAVLKPGLAALPRTGSPAPLVTDS